jgi:nucleotide-binding universal stress UspA family protein
MIWLAVLVAFAAGLTAGVVAIRARRPKPAALEPSGSERILFPFIGGALSERALEASLRLARAEGAALVPAYLVTVPMALHLDAPLPSACGTAFELLETIEQRAAAAGVRVDGRIGRGRNRRHAMRQLMANERFDRIVVAAGDEGFTADDVAWLLTHAAGEVIVLRPADDRFLRARPAEPDYTADLSGYTSSMVLSGSKGQPAAA